MIPTNEMVAEAMKINLPKFSDDQDPPHPNVPDFTAVAVYKAMLNAAPESEDSVAHHGPAILTTDGFELCQMVVKWIRTVRGSQSIGYGNDWLPSQVDFIKSRL